jgi:AraC-like DNA-binding protein
MFNYPAPISEIIGVGRFRPAILPSRPIMAPTHHTIHELICVLHGHFHVAAGGRARVFTAGDVVLYPAETRHLDWTDTEAPAECLWIGFACPLNEQPTGMAVLRDPRGRIAEIASWMIEDTLDGREQAHPELRAMLVAILAELERGITEAYQAPWVKQVQDHIQAHLAGDLSLPALAQVAQLSPFHFLRMYKRATGHTPMAAVRAMRLQRARQLLVSTRMPLKEVAALAGLGNPYAMDGLFRRCLGIPPGRLRQHHR